MVTQRTTSKLQLLKAFLTTSLSFTAITHAYAKPTPKPVATPTKITSQKADTTNKKELSIIKTSSSKERNEPVYITSDKLVLDATKRVFTYTGNVKVVQADITITAREMVGSYSEDNKIELITAKKDVVVVRAPDMRATSQMATYEANTKIVTLTENPHLFQGGSDLAADKITIDLTTNKSFAEGQVQMKVVKAAAGETTGTASSAK